MKIRKIAAVAVLVLGSLAADNVAPSKAELEAMYDKAFRAFDANNFPEALKQLDAIDTRQPDLAESQNLRGVILMRQGIYDKAEAALHEALRIDPKFWNARFNLAEIPFLEKNWSEARTRFQDLLSNNVSELQGFQQRDFAAARQFIDEADAADANQTSILNLRGEILMEQKEFDQAEASFKKAIKLDPKFREAQYNLAQIPFKKKDYPKARERFENLFSQTPGGDKNQASQLIKFKIFMTLLLEGKESRAQKMMEQFQFTGDTPALYYAQAAWEFKHNNPNKASDWVTSAKKIYSAALNSVFADAFYDLGWMQSPAIAAGPAPASEAAAVMSAQTEASPAIEPSPIPGAALAANKQAKEAKAETKSESKPESVAASSPAASPLVSWKE